MAPSDFHLFRSLKNWLKGKRFESTGEVEDAIHDYFFSRNPDFYERGINNVVERWKEVIDDDGEYCV